MDIDEWQYSFSSYFFIFKITIIQFVGVKNAGMMRKRRVLEWKKSNFPSIYILRKWCCVCVWCVFETGFLSFSRRNMWNFAIQNANDTVVNIDISIETEGWVSILFITMSQLIRFHYSPFAYFCHFICKSPTTYER